MIDNEEMFKSTSQEYKVFPCLKCGKWTYAKANQKARKCGICGKNHFISEITNYESAKNVALAAKIAQAKNIEWQTSKGIKINQPPPKPKKEFNSGDSEYSSPNKISSTSEKQNQNYSEILSKIKENIIQEHLPQPIPSGFLAILYEKIAKSSPSFARCVLFGINNNIIQGNSNIGYSFL